MIVTAQQIKELRDKTGAGISDVKKAHNALTFKKGKGSEFTGWMELPGQVQDSFFQDLKK